MVVGLAGYKSSHAVNLYTLAPFLYDFSKLSLIFEKMLMLHKIGWLFLFLFFVKWVSKIELVFLLGENSLYNLYLISDNAFTVFYHENDYNIRGFFVFDFVFFLATPSNAQLNSWLCTQKSILGLGEDHKGLKGGGIERRP